MSNKSIKSILKENKKTIENPFYFENVWHLNESDIFDKEMKEFYQPDIWFIGKNRIFEREIASAIDKANDLIVICSFLIQETDITNALLKAAKKGVRIYILTASEQRLAKDQGKENETENERIEDHKKLISKLKTKCFIRTARHFHAKYVLIDPKNESCTGYLSSANFTQHALANNVEIGIKLDGKQIKELFNTFCQVFWYEAEHESLSRESLRSVKKLSEKVFKTPEVNAIFTTKLGKGFKKTLEEKIQNTKGSIHICTYSISHSTSLFDLLIKQLNSGRKLYVYTRPRKKDLEALEQLSKKGAIIKGHNLLHMKGLFIEDKDKTVGMIFTGNLTKESFEGSYDVGIILSDNQNKKIFPIIKSWNKIIPCTFYHHIGIKNLKIGKYLKWSKEKEIILLKDNEEINQGNFKLKDIDSLKRLDSKLKIPDSMKYNAKKYTFYWRLISDENEK